MKRSPSNSSQPGLWARLFRRREREKSHSSLGRRLRRALLLAGAALAALYLLGAFAGYAWMRYGRKNDQITFSQVALLRWRNVRRGVAVQQFAQGEKERAAGNYQAAYLAYVSGVRNDPDNIPGRLAAANLLVEANGLNMAVSLLEDGITRAPDSRPLLDRLFDLLTASGRDQRALDLLRRRPASQFSGANGPLLRTYEILATLNAEGAGPAKALLDRHPELEKNDAAAPVLARVLWESQQKLKAIDLLSRHVAAGTAPYSDHAQLAQWQLAAGLPDKALQTAVAVLTPEDKRSSTLAALLRRWSGAPLAATAAP